MVINMFLDNIKDFISNLKDSFLSASIAVKSVVIIVPVVSILGVFLLLPSGGENSNNLNAITDSKEAPKLVLAQEGGDCLSFTTPAQLETCLTKEAVKASLATATFAEFDSKLNKLISNNPSLDVQCYQSLRYIVSNDEFRNNFDKIVNVVKSTSPTACNNGFLDAVTDYGIRQNGEKFIPDLAQICVSGPAYSSDPLKKRECYVAIGQSLLGITNLPYEKSVALCEKSLTGDAITDCTQGYFMARYTEILPGGSPFDRSLSELPDICPSLSNPNSSKGCVAAAGALLGGNLFRSIIPSMRESGYDSNSKEFKGDVEDNINSGVARATAACAKYKDKEACNNGFADIVINYGPMQYTGGDHFRNFICSKNDYALCKK
jgi:hypothetical protein